MGLFAFRSGFPPTALMSLYFEFQRWPIPAFANPGEATMLKPPQNQREAAKGTFTSSVALLANVLAFAAAMLGTGPAYSASIGWVRDFTAAQYGAAFSDLASLVWFVVVGLTVFAFARASLATTITLGGLALAARLF